MKKKILSLALGFFLALSPCVLFAGSGTIETPSGYSPEIQTDSFTFYHNAGAANGPRLYALIDLGKAGLKQFFLKGDSNNVFISTSDSGTVFGLPSLAIDPSTLTVEYEAILPGTAKAIHCEVSIQQVPPGANPQIATLVWANSGDGTVSDDAGRNYYLAPRASITNLPAFSAKNDGSGFSAGFDQPVVILSTFSSSIELDTTVANVSNIYFDVATSRFIHNNALVGADIVVTIPESADSQLLGNAGVVNVFIDDATGTLYHNFSFIPQTVDVLVSNDVGYIPVHYNANAAVLYAPIYTQSGQFRFVSPTSSNKTVSTSQLRQPDLVL